MSGEPLEPQEGEPLAGFEPGRLKDVKLSDMGVRFAFGAGMSVVAGLAGNVFSPVVGGMFLAFPAILPATLTLLEKKHGTEAAVHDDRGAVLGAIGLVAFALVAAALFTVVAPAFVLIAATVAWAVAAVAVYLAVAAWRRENKGPSRP